MLLAIENLQKTYAGPEGRLNVLRGITMSLASGETVALTGESGSGKSTILHLIAGLDAPDGGRVLIDGQEISTMDDARRAKLRREAIGIVFQQFNLIPSMTVEANLSFQARLKGVSDPALTRRLAEALGLLTHLRKYPEQLSGGQQQRVAIGRALAARPRLILADEPTGNLDEDTAAAVMDEFLWLVEETGAALLVATHSERIADWLGRRLYLSQGRFA